MVRVGSLVMVFVVACGGSSAGHPDGQGPGGDDDDAPPGSCTEAWSCTGWTTDGASNNATRTCTDANACGTTAQKPTETATLPALDPEYYECKVEPIVQGGCAMLGCHGTETGRAYRVYARGRLRMTGGTITQAGCTGGPDFPSESCTGNEECKCWMQPMLATERRRSFDSARGFALGDDGQPLADMTTSQLLRQPQVGGGYAHAGIQWWSAGDASYNTVKAWLDGAQLGSTCNSGN